jgi:ElaB/YqjD/DUF883 family membrane-anchored ribosome-binding protein
MNDAKKKTLTQHQLRAELDQRKELLDYHLSGLQSELTVADVNVGGRPILDHVRERPLVAAGVAAGVGVLAGLVTGLMGREAPEEPSDHDLWMGAYLDDLVDDAGYRVQGGEDAGVALRKALRSRAPVIVLEPEEEPVKERASSIFSLVLNTALGFGVKFALDQMAQELTGEDEIVTAMEHAHDEPPASSGAPAPPAVTPVEPHFQ